MADRRTAGDLELRRATSADDDQVLSLLGASLGWVPDDQYRAFFNWKHRESPFGESPAWVAVDGDRIVGLRIFLRWEFEEDGVVQRAVRAVDTATHPDYQGRGIFTRLTLRALDELEAEGVDFVFNTPNVKSLPGYLKMGWVEMGRQPIAVRPRLRPGSLARLARARVPADKWSQPSNVGVAPSDAFSDGSQVEALLASSAARPGLRTLRSLAFLRWRYGFGPLAYRVIVANDLMADGFVVFRCRRRGPATEATITDVVVPRGDQIRHDALSRRVMAEAPADYALVAAEGSRLRAGFAPFPGQGPLVTWRALARSDAPDVDTWALVMADLELF